MIGRLLDRLVVYLDSEDVLLYIKISCYIFSSGNRPSSIGHLGRSCLRLSVTSERRQSVFSTFMVWPP